MRKEGKMKFDFLMKMSEFFNVADNYWDNVSISPQCCEESRLSENEIENTSMMKINDFTSEAGDVPSQDLTFGEPNHPKISFKMKLDQKDIEEKKVNKVQAKSKKIESDLQSQPQGKRQLLDKSSIWNDEEDTMLIRLCASKIKTKWKKISEIIGTKSSTQCAYRYKILKKKKLTIVKKPNDEDILFSDQKIRKYFKKFQHLRIDSKNDRNETNNIGNGISNQNSLITRDQSLSNRNLSSLNSTKFDFFKISKPNFQNDTMDFPEFYELGGTFSHSIRTDSLATPDSVELNAKIIKNNSENIIERNGIKVDSANSFFDIIMRKNSPDLLLMNINIKTQKDPKDSTEFKNEFNKNFKKNDQDGSQDDLIFKTNDFKVQDNKLNGGKIINHHLNSEKIQKIENFVKSVEFTNPNMDELNTIYLKMTNFISEINSITNRKSVLNNQVDKEQITRALELQTIILTHMISLTQRRLLKSSK